MKALRTIIALGILAACIVIGVRIMGQRAQIQALHEQYETADSPEEFRELKGQYQALKEGASGETRRHIEAHIAGCEAWIAFYDTTARPSVPKYRDAIAKMRRAKDLTGDTQGVWTDYIRTFETRLQESMGPRHPQEMRARFERLAEQPFSRSRQDLENLYLWKSTWERQLTYPDVDESEAQELRETLEANADTFAQMEEHLLENYARLFEEAVAAAREVEISDEEMRRLNPELEEGPLAEKAYTLMRPAGALPNVARFDEEMAARYEQEYADELALARDITQRMLED